MNKYNARRAEIDGLKFDSQAEARRWQELLLLQQAGQICELRHHPRYDITINGVKVCVYEADSAYFEVTPTGWQLVVEDVKGVRTAVYRLKQKLIQAVYGIEIREIDP